MQLKIVVIYGGYRAVFVTSVIFYQSIKFLQENKQHAFTLGKNDVNDTKTYLAFLPL